VRSDRASGSAEAVALTRCLESELPVDHRLFEDRFARRFLGPLPRAIAELCRIAPLRVVLLGAAELAMPGARGIAVGRTRFIDDAFAAALDAGAEQVVILGAGYDCRAYRMAGAERARIFKVDHPATQARKRERLQLLLSRLPDHVTFVPIDFNRERLADALERASFESGRRTFFVWEGVTEYLSAEAVDATLGFVVAVSGRGSEIVFTYTDIGVIEGTTEFAGAKRVARLNRLGGEPYTFGFDPKRLRTQLRERGLELVADVAGAEYAERYFRPHRRRIVGNEYERTVLARVVGGAR
jgi:methyltransferase (TIGR00027 family)